MMNSREIGSCSTRSARRLKPNMFLNIFFFTLKLGEGIAASIAEGNSVSLLGTSIFGLASGLCCIFWLSHKCGNFRRSLLLWNQKELQPLKIHRQERHGVSRDPSSKNQLRLMQRAIEASSNGIVICDGIAADMPIIYANSKFEQLTGYRREEVIGRNCRFLQGTDRNQPAIAQLRQSILEGKECHAILRNYRKDGRLFWNELHLAPVRNEQGHLTHFIGIQTDVTERQQLEETLRLLLERTSKTLGQEFFRTLVCHLASLLAVRYAGISAILEARTTQRNESANERLRVIAFWDGEQESGGFDYAIAGTPCEAVFQQGMVLYPKNVQALFPQDEYLREQKIESYWAVALYDTAGQPLGHLFVMDNKPLVPAQWSESLLKILAVRIGAELERARAEEALRDSQTRLSGILEIANDAIISIDEKGCIQLFNQGAERVFGYKSEEILGQPLDRLLPQRYRTEHQHYIQGFSQSADRARRMGKRPEVLARRKDGTEFAAEASISQLELKDGKIFTAILRDITATKKAEEALRESEARLRTIVAATSDAIVVVDLQGRIRFANPAAVQLFNRPLEELLEHWFGWPSVSQDITEIEIRQPSGKLIIAEMRAAETTWDEEKVYLASLRDITERKQVEAQLQHNAFYDALTDLPNRTLFMERLDRAIRRLRWRGGYPFAVFFLDLDNFKAINDSLGHMSGDRLLVAIARRLKSCLRPSDTFARLGGDEFTILLEEIENPTEAVTVARRIHEVLKSPFNLDDRHVFTNASIGIAFGSEDYTSPEELLRDADAAMYQAKAWGRGHYAVFDQKMHETVVARLQLETDLRLALEREEFLVYYQPIIDLSSGATVGFEALARWQHPTRGFITPDAFIPIAEETGLIVPLGWWVLREACHQLSLWQQQFPSDSPLSIGVNLSGKQLKEPDAVRQIQSILAQTGIDGSCLKLEIVESLLMDDTEATLATLAQLRAMKVQLAIDDFGTGYSSLSYLHRFPVTTLKIDRSFTIGMKADRSNGEIIKAVVSLAQALKMDAIAEGIETLEQLTYLQELGCQYGQGYFWAIPLNARAASAFVARSPRDY